MADIQLNCKDLSDTQDHKDDKERSAQQELNLLIKDIDKLSTQSEMNKSNVDTNKDNITVVLGDSILAGASSEQADIIAESGASLDRINPMLTQVRNRHPHVDNLVIALGTNDYSRTTSTGSTSALFSKAVLKAQEMLPEAHIFLSAIVPRREVSTHMKACNDNIHEINNFLKDTSRGSTNVTYIGNASTFNRAAHENLYRKRDNVHLSSLGKSRLVEIIEDNVAKYSTPSKKRGRVQGTPPSTEKEAKQRKEDEH